MTDCELVSTCPYYIGVTEMPECCRKEYCQGEYRWCGRYMVWRDLERERRSRFNPKMGWEGGEALKLFQQAGIE